MQAANLADVVREDGNLVSNHLASHAIVEDDGFTAVNTAFLRDGAYVRVPEGSSPESTLHLIFVTTERPQPIVSYPRTLVLVGKHGRLTVVESYVSQSQAPYFTNAVTEMVVSEGAQVEHYRYLMESPGAFHVGTTRVYQERDSTFNSTSFATGSRLARNDLQVLLDGPGSSCTVNGLYVTSGTQHIDNHIDIDHAQPHTTSNQYFKGILGGQSRAVFSGRVVVRRDAQKANARQSDKNLILSEGARVNTKPSLEIFADDVQCAHGATAGAVADDALFYMRSRGLDEEAARRLLVYGFASEIIDTVRLGPLRQHLEGMFSGKAQAAGRVTGS
jgi:Fe-S cluster assembly protein SufD